MKSPAWQTKEGKNPKGGLNAKGRASYNAETGGNLKPPVKSGDNPRRASFLAGMGNNSGPEMKDGSQHDFSYPSRLGVLRPKKTLKRKQKRSLRGTRSESSFS